MGSLMLTDLVRPSGLWETIIYWIESGVLNYGLTIILFTFMLKLVLSPLDFFIKYTSKKTSLIQKKLSPQVTKLQKKYANNQTALNAQMNVLYKKEGLNMVTSCLVMLINLVLTLVIFFTVFASLRNIASYKMVNQYDILKNTYMSEEYTTIEAREEAVIIKYNEIKDSFLWINSIWRPDTWSSQIPTYNELKTAVKNSSKSYKEYVNEIDEETYEKVMGPIRDANSGWNGYLILAVLSGIMAYVSQKIMEKSNDIKGVKDPQVPQSQSMAIMKFLLPAINVIFILTSNSAFGLYLLTSSIASTLLSLIINILVNKSTAKLEEDTKQVLLKYEQKQLKR